MIEGVIFDMDGLMFDTERVGMEVWGAELEAEGCAFTPEVGQAIRGRNATDIHQMLRERYGEGLDCQKVHARVRKHMEVRLNQEGVPVKPGLLELMKWLKQQKIPMALASSSRKETVELRCIEAGILQDFDAVICGDMVEHSKPEPDIFWKAAQMIGAAPEHSIVLEDSFNGIRAGHAGGFITIMVPDLDQPTPEIEKLYSAKAESLLEVLERLQQGEWE